MNLMEDKEIFRFISLKSNKEKLLKTMYIIVMWLAAVIMNGVLELRLPK